MPVVQTAVQALSLLCCCAQQLAIGLAPASCMAGAALPKACGLSIGITLRQCQAGGCSQQDMQGFVTAVGKLALGCGNTGVVLRLCTTYGLWELMST